MKYIILCLSSLLLFSVFPLYTSANPLPFMPDKDSEIKPVSSDSLFGGLTRDIGEIVAPLYGWGITIITALFVIGAVVMILSMIFKNGQWQKYGQGTMFISFVVMLVLRGMPIIFLSVRSSADIDSLLNSSLTVLSSSAVILGLIGIAVSFLFKFGYRLIDHPDFHRWARNLMSVSIMMMLFAIVIPILFPTI